MEVIESKLQNLQQVMSPVSLLARIEENEKLVGESNFKVWSSLLRLNCEIIDPLVANYLMEGEHVVANSFGIDLASGNVPGDVQVMFTRLIGVMDRFIYGQIVKSVSASVLMDIRATNIIGRALFLHLSSKFGSMDFQRIVASVGAIVKSPSNSADIDKASGIIQVILDNVLRERSPDEIAALLLLNFGCTGSVKEKVINNYAFGSDKPLDLSTVKQMIKAFAANSTSDDAAFIGNKKLIRCYSCGGLGHIAKQCFKSKAGNGRHNGSDTRDSKADGDKNSDKKATGWIALNAVTDTRKTNFYFDSGANHHVVNSRELFSEFEDIEDSITGLGGEVPVLGQGTVVIKLAGVMLPLRDVLYVPSAVTNLISLSRALDSGETFILQGKELFWNEQKKVIAAMDDSKLFKAYCTPVNGKIGLISQAPMIGLSRQQLWHNRLGHPSKGVFRALNNKIGFVPKVQDSEFGSVAKLCETCSTAKAVQVIPKFGAGARTTQPLQLLHMDLSGPFRYDNEINEARYYLTIVDDFSKMVFARPIKAKSDTVDHVIQFIHQWERYFNGRGDYKVSAIRTDNGGEFNSNKMHTFCVENGISHQLTVSHSSYQNGTAERFNRTIQERARCLLEGAHVPVELWSEAVSTAAFLINRLPSRSLKMKLPYKLWYGWNPSFEHIKTFGCAGYVLVPHSLRDGKLSDVSVKCVFVGYEVQRKAYRLYDPKTNKIVVSAQVNFDETEFPFANGLSVGDSAVKNVFGSGVLAGGISAPSAVHLDGGVASTSDIRNRDSNFSSNDTQNMTESVDSPDPESVDSDATSDEYEVEDESSTTRGASSGGQDELSSQHSVPDDNVLSAESPESSNLESDISTAPAAPASDLSSTGVKERLARRGVGIMVPQSHDNDGWTVVNSRKRARSPSPSSGCHSSSPSNRFMLLEDNVGDNEDQEVVDEALSSEITVSGRDNRSESVETEILNNGMALVPSGGGNYESDTSVAVINSTTHDAPATKRLKGSINLAASCFISAERRVRGKELTFKQAMESEDRDKWERACDEEMDSHDEHGTMSVVDLPEGKKVIGSRWVLVIKDDGRYKARLVAQGFSQQYGVDYTEVFSPVIRYDSIKVLVSYAAKFGLEIYQMDVKTAFLNGKLDEEVYMKIAPGSKYEGTGKVYRLHKSIYGLKQSPKIWNDTINRVLSGNGFVKCPNESCLYYKETKVGPILIGLYVDDLLICGKQGAELNRTKELLSKHFKMKDLGLAKKFLGMNVTQTKDCIKLDLGNYIEKAIKDFGFEDAHGVDTPMVTGFDLEADNVKRPCDTFKYRSMIGKLMFASSTVRADICYAVSILSRMLQEPTEYAFKGGVRVLKYLKGTKDIGLVYPKGEISQDMKFDLTLFSDASWANDTKDRKSTSGCVSIANGTAITWKSKKQDIVALSTTEAEYIALCETVKESSWLLSLFKDLHVNIDLPVTIFEDNESAILLAKHSAFHNRTKHIDIRYHYIRSKVEDKTVKIESCDTKDMIADLFTKPLPGPQFIKLRNLCGML